MRIRTPIRVRYGETDMMGVVYHANYLLYFEDARIDFLEKAGHPYQIIEDAGCMSPILDLQVSYGRPLRYGEEAFVETRIVETTGAKTVYGQRVFPADADPLSDEPLVDARITCCVVDRKDFRPVSFKRRFPELYRLYRDIMEPEEDIS